MSHGSPDWGISRLRRGHDQINYRGPTRVKPIPWPSLSDTTRAVLRGVEEASTWEEAIGLLSEWRGRLRAEVDRCNLAIVECEDHLANGQATGD